MSFSKTTKPSTKEDVVFRKFPVQNVRENRIFLLLGPRGSGKTTLMKTMLWHLRNRVEFVVAWFGTQDTVAEFRGILPDCLMYCGISSFNADMLNSIIQLQETWNRLSQFSEDKSKYKIKSILLMMDDLMSDPAWMKTEAIVNCHTNGRHLGLTLLNTAQYMMTLPALLRSQIDYVMVFYSSSPAWITRLYDQFFGGWFERTKFKAIYKKLTEERRVMVLDNTSKATLVTDVVFIFSADPKVEQFTVGSDKMWLLSYMFTKRESARQAENEEAERRLKNQILDQKLGRCTTLADGSTVRRDKSPKSEVSSRKGAARPRKKAIVARQSFRLDGDDVSVMLSDEI
jgi:energy-coupling factor transporter ATP-binding protein EcfA2